MQDMGRPGGEVGVIFELQLPLRPEMCLCVGKPSKSLLLGAKSLLATGGRIDGTGGARVGDHSSG